MGGRAHTSRWDPRPACGETNSPASCFGSPNVVVNETASRRGEIDTAGE
jgi:hypothetical protein